MNRGFTALSGEERKAYFEYYAREVLVSLLPEEFNSLHKTDKPDLQDVFKSIGIEVTLALFDSELYAVRLYNELIDTRCGKKKKRIKECLKKINVELLRCDGKVVGIGYPLVDNTSEPLITAAKKKIERLNNTGDDTIYEYYEYQHYRLFIFTSIATQEQGFLDELIDVVVGFQQECERKYEVIYVYSEWFGLWECDLETRQIREFPVTGEQREYFKRRAFSLAESVE